MNGDNTDKRSILDLNTFFNVKDKGIEFVKECLRVNQSHEDGLYYFQFNVDGRTDGFMWVGYDCGHVGETYDKNAIQQYYPDEADNLIKKFSLRYTNSSPPVIRSLDWCKEQNAKLAKVMNNTQKAYIADEEYIEKQNRGR